MNIYLPMSWHDTKPSKLNEDDCEEYDEENIMPEHLTKDLRNLKDDKNPNLYETEREKIVELLK